MKTGTILYEIEFEVKYEAHLSVIYDTACRQTTSALIKFYIQINILDE